MIVALLRTLTLTQPPKAACHSGYGVFTISIPAAEFKISIGPTRPDM